MPDDDLPDQTIVNLEAYLMGTNPPAEMAVAFAKLAREVRRRRFEAIGNKIDLEWRRNFRTYAKHLPICRLMLDGRDDNNCTCGLIELMEKAKFVV
jgi:hypothetical protein